MGASTRNIKPLLNKKGWTGDEVGRAMMADLVKSYSNLIESKATDDTGLLTDAEKRQLVNSLTRPEDIKRYNEYRYLHDFIATLPMRYTLAQAIADKYFWRLYSLLKQTYKAERNKNYYMHMPHIVTQVQYDRLKQASFKERISESYSVETLVLYTISYFFDHYTNDIKTPFNKYFTAAKTQPITNPRIKSNYLQRNSEDNIDAKIDPKFLARSDRHDKASKAILDFDMEDEFNAFSSKEPATVDQIIEAIHKRKEADLKEDEPEDVEQIDNPTSLEPEEDLTLFDILEVVAYDYYSAFTDNKQTFFELEQDFPDLYKAVWNYLTKLKPLTFLKDTPKAEYVTNRDLIPVKTLYDNKILDFKEKLDTFDPTFEDYVRGIAVLQPSSSLNLADNINEAEEYAPKFDPIENDFFVHRAEMLIEKTKEFRDWLDMIKIQYRNMYAYHTFLALTSEFCGIKGLEILIEPINERYITILNYIFEAVNENLCSIRTGEEAIPVDELRERLEEVFQPIKISDLQPTEETIKKARQKMSFKVFQGHAVDFIVENILKEGGD